MILLPSKVFFLSSCLYACPFHIACVICMYMIQKCAVCFKLKSFRSISCLFLSRLLSVSPSSLRSALLRSLYICKCEEKKRKKWTDKNRTMKSFINESGEKEFILILFRFRISVEIPWQRAIQSDDVIYYILHGFSPNEIFRQCFFFSTTKLLSVVFSSLIYFSFSTDHCTSKLYKRKRDQWQR